ncbi:g11661 [Coccomyxa viridis]|uniref:Kinesin-like protein n=1 Tax=Coccomyxa viridis TaxID=1274662 RepID=A0ABP1G8I4_9CHLO
MARIRELEHRLFDPDGILGSGDKGDGLMARLADMYRRLSATELAKMLLFTEDNDGDAENVNVNCQASEGQARKVAAQAVIELTDRLAAAEEEAAALRRHLKHTRSLTKVGQELEDVLTERDALRAVNKELAKRVTAPDTPCDGKQQADELKAKIEVLKSASLEASEQVQSLQEETGRLRAELASRAMELDLVQADAAQASQQAQRSAAHADSMQEAIGRLQAELTSKTEELLQASFIILNILIICMATEHAQREAAHAAEELAQTQLELGQSREAEQRALDAQSSLEQERATLREALETERERGDVAECAAHSAQQTLAELEAAHAQQAQQLGSLNDQLAEVRHDLGNASAKARLYEERYKEERALRREVHEELQMLRGNIRVVCRARPGTEQSVLAFPLPGAITVFPPDRTIKEFEFNACFGPESSQEDVWEHVAPLIRSCADGYNACIFAYGQTGSGKTHTMQGPEDDPGVYQRALQELFCATSGSEVSQGADISVAMLEIYKEDVRDLLASESSKALDVCGLGPGRLPPGVDRIAGLTWRPVKDVADVAAALAHGTEQRATSATAMNATSSRSHAVLSVKLAFAEGGQSSLHLVDLAGSERIGRSEVVGQALKEAQSINKSLSALGDVICALQASAKHIPFRNSKLTQVLQDSLCGSSKVMLVCNLSPEAASAGETLSSLNFASRAAQVELGPAKRAAELTAASTPGSTPSTGASSRRKPRAGAASPSDAATGKSPAEGRAKAVVYQDFAGRFHAA